MNVNVINKYNYYLVTCCICLKRESINFTCTCTEFYHHSACGKCRVKSDPPTNHSCTTVCIKKKIYTKVPTLGTHVKRI